ncbi:preprotein translocase subunit [Coleophoma cylindrospora]|uniref:Preprotein translocase subunit n=1 Tax=Coleophoma cylindrospora TaxID=1849047 RepID=A0A3D8RBB0_9HELO|nr:preprotein translocase subunit [Coleophoma cylindrospora]
MSSTDYSYDDQGQFFPFFIITIVAVFTLPLTYNVLKPSSEPGATAPRIKTDFRPKHAVLIDEQKRAQKKRERKLKRGIAVVVGWAVMFFMAYLIVVTARTQTKIWNPYDILGISESATEKAIKSHYKRLSLKFHPDKVRPDPSKNITLESLNDRFVELTKAYKALTDEEIRNNYIQYGHPDGKQSFSIGIALPSFMITEGNGKFVILVYALLLGVLMPYTVGVWWYGTQALSKEKVLIESANNLFKEYDERTTEGGIITALSTGAEFKSILKGDKAESGQDKLEARILAEGEATPLAGGLTIKDRAKLEDLDGGVRRKALGLLWAYLGRVELNDQALEQAKVEVAPIAHALTQSYLAIAMAYGTVGPILNAYRTMQCLIQAVPPTASPLLQIPHFTPATVRAVEGDARTHLTVQQYMQIQEARRRSLTVGKGLLTESEYDTAMKVVKQLPRFQVEKVFFKVAGEKYITPGSLAFAVVKGRFIPPGSTNVPEVNELDLEDIDPAEDDVDAILGRKKTPAKGEAPVANDKPSQPPLAFAPYYARDYSPRWHLFLTDSKQDKMAVNVHTYTQFEKPIFDESGAPTYNMQTMKASFQTPPQAGQYTFVLNVVCDSYVGFDTKVETILTVDEASKAEEIAIEDEISEPDEDSLAGQMSMLKNGGAPPPPRRKKAVEDDDDDSDESNTEGEVDDDTSETNTDTDEE